MPGNKRGRRHLDYTDAGPRLKRKLASELAAEHSTPLLLHAASVSAKKSNEKQTAFVLKKAVSNENITGIIRKLERSDPLKISADEALAFLIENGFTKQQYINIKALNKQHGCDIYPPYSEIVKSKLKCRPKEIRYGDTKTEVTMQNLLDHTADRILEM